MDRARLLALAERVLRLEAEAVLALATRLDDRFVAAVELIAHCRGRVIVTGMGKSGLVGRKVAATMASTGTPAYFLHPAEGVHGDIGMVARDDVVVALSNSGETDELLAVLPALKRLGVPMVLLTGGLASSLAKQADVVLDVGVSEEACPMNLAPTSSTTAALAMGDALAMGLLERRGFTIEDFAVLHPGGRIGKKLVRVEDVMHAGDLAPRVRPDAPMREVLFEMTKKRLGMTTVVDAAGTLLGMISDGDLRRHMERDGYALLDQTAGQCMTSGPLTVRRRDLATAALAVMEDRKITSLPVVDAAGVVEGVVHLHDLWKTEMI